MTGLVVLMMSVTGVILTYERQMLAWADRAALSRVAPARESRQRQTIEALVAAVRSREPDFVPSAITLSSDVAMPASLSAGRSGARLIDPFSGAPVGDAERLRRFFGAVTGWHRWFNAGVDDRALWRALTGASNLTFLFLIVTGIYLWLPRAFKWAAFRANLFFSAKALSGKARDFNWHHVFGIWSAVPLAVVVATAVVFSYSWANDLVYAVFGETAAQRVAAAAPSQTIAPGLGGTGTRDGNAADTVGARRSLDELFDIAAQRVGGWRTITLQLPQEDEPSARLTIDRGNGGQPQHRYALTLDRSTGQATSWEPFTSQTPGRRARSWVRFLHTGEALGLVGQTIAGLVSLTSIIMVWTGLALAYRRLIAPVLGRKAGA